MSELEEACVIDVTHFGRRWCRTHWRWAQVCEEGTMGERVADAPEQSPVADSGTQSQPAASHSTAEQEGR